MKPRSFVIALVVLAGLALATWMQRQSTDAAPPAPTNTTTTNDAAPSVATNSPTVDRSAAGPGAVVTAPATERSLVLRGRCVAAADGAPIASATITLHEDPEGVAGRERRRVASTTTSTDGRFVVASPCVDLLVADLTASGFGTMTGRWRADRPRDLDLGDVRLLAATIVEGEVVTDRGQPVEAAEMMLATITPEAPGFAPRTIATTETGADGHFRFPDLIPTGDWYAMVKNAGGLIEPRNVHVPAGIDRHFLRVVTTTPDPATAIRGIVVDTNGAPMERVDLRANGDGATGSARTRADGTFLLHRAGQFTDNGERDVLVFVTEPSGDFELATEQPRTRWGANDVRIVMRRFAATTLVVHDAAGTPIADADVFVMRLTPNNVIPRLVRLRGRADGRVAVPRLGSHRYVVIGRPLDGAAPSTPVPLIVENGIAPNEVHVVIAPPENLAVDVVDTNGTAMSGSQVEAILGLVGNPPAPGAQIPRFATARTEDLLRQASLVVAEATTDVNGRAVMPLHDGDWHLRVRGALHTPVVVPAAMRGKGTATRVVVETAGRIVGRCEPLAALAKLRAAAGPGDAAIELAAMQGTTQGARSVVAADGTFALDGLRAGSWTLRLWAPLRCSDEHTGNYWISLGDVVVANGTTERSLTIDHALPAIASGTVTLDGAPWPRVQMTLTRDQPRAVVRAVADANGRFRTLLPPGEWLVAVAFAAQPGPGWNNVVLPQRWTAVPDREEERTLAVRTRTAKVRVLDAANVTIANARVRIEASLGYYRPGALTTDANGVVTITDPPLGPFDLLFTAGDREVRVGPIESLDDTGTTVIDARPRTK